ncbi:ABC transporter ATP-binding protein [Ruicaihuangia caeni]|uniref:ATP-binding cassette domain-containing protein n=1 Tax=Ruicaihuangia caeni TaxID=3042517 RepID=A0AAW6T7G3_9MICO|nr:ATP-binding cassette domain-containing protein [Klugiella sp. YN-L-19]MDI2097572.1 ATP-binding cassette domain-containing protein [Klugiella sp. YN-L-19]
MEPGVDDRVRDDLAPEQQASSGVRTAVERLAPPPPPAPPVAPTPPGPPAAPSSPASTSDADAESDAEAASAPAEAKKSPAKKTTAKKAPAKRAPAKSKANPVKRVAPHAASGSRSAPAKPRPRKAPAEVVLRMRNLTKYFNGVPAVDAMDLEVPAGSFYGIVGPNGAGKTTTLSMATGLLRPDAGLVTVHGADVWLNPALAKRQLGVLPDRLRLFDRLTGAQFLHYAGSLRGLDTLTLRGRSADLAKALGLEDALDRVVGDYSLGMTKKIALAAAMLHSPRVLVLDEPFEAVDPVSTATIIEMLQRYTASGGTVLLSSHSMDLIQRVCSHVAIMVSGRVLASGTMGKVRARKSLEQRFIELAGADSESGELEWLHSFSD